MHKKGINVTPGPALRKGEHGNCPRHQAKWGPASVVKAVYAIFFALSHFARLGPGRSKAAMCHIAPTIYQYKKVNFNLQP